MNQLVIYFCNYNIKLLDISIVNMFGRYFTAKVKKIKEKSIQVNYHVNSCQMTITSHLHEVEKLRAMNCAMIISGHSAGLNARGKSRTVSNS